MSNIKPRLNLWKVYKLSLQLVYITPKIGKFFGISCKITKILL